jgi:6-pyruvoyl-tetrahydropterin synthase
MQHRYHLRTTIDASHDVGSMWAPCGERLHGHTWDIEIDVLYDPLDEDMEWNRMNDAIDELDGRHLNDMIKPAQATPYGLANWLMERLRPHIRVERVAAFIGDSGSSVTADEVRRK